MRSMDEWLGSEETGEAFSHCIRCRLPLPEIAAPWLVNKEFHREECVLEYAICQPCRDRVAEQFSEDSKEAVRKFLEQQIDWDERVKEFMLAHDATERFTACISCRTPREELDGFGISALFDSGGDLVGGAAAAVDLPGLHRADDGIHFRSEPPGLAEISRRPFHRTTE